MSSCLDHRPDMSVAIVGMAFRFPGDISDEQSFWTALKAGRDLVGRVPAERWAVDELQHSKRSEPGRSITFSAGVLSRIDEFDAAFFGISPREAAWLDPQQRLLLELAWEAMENGGQVPSSLAGTDCAVYVGISSLDYGTRGLDDLASMTAHSMTGNTLSIAANRLSYVFDLRGPSLAVDTACSSSLVALHQACNSLRAGEASTALVGGVNLLLHPYPFVGFTKASMLSANGRCRAFDEAGDGYVRAEGGAVLLLKPLADALADGDDIQAIIRATGTNADGARKTGITIPSRDGQAELMRMVLSRSGLSSLEVDYIEAHGTGTAVGDPIEASAIGSVYGQCRPPDRPLPIGSVKTNLGHLEPASGMAGLVKAVLVLKNRALPPMLHLVSPNPHVDFSGLNLEPVTKYTELTREDDKPLVAGVNSFGFGGANAHVLLQEFRARDIEPHPEASRVPPLLLSARTNDALRAMAGSYSELLRNASLQDFYDIAHAAAYRREFLEKRLALQVDNTADAPELLARYASGEAADRVIVEDSLTQPGGVAFVYSGNGAQWIGMGQKLLAESARFAEILAEIDAVMEPLSGFSIIKELSVDEIGARIDDTVIAQPLLFAIQVAVTTLLSEQGVAPAAVTGHSVGEVAAAWAAGALDLDQAVRVICARSTAQGLTRGAGRMASVALSEAAMMKTLTELGGNLDVEIAGINSPGNVTISGNLADLEHIRAHVEPKGVFFRLLDLDYAFHSHQMDAIESRILESLADLLPVSATAPVYVSTVTGDILDGADLGADYWWRNVRQPVRFAEAIAKIVDLGCRVFIEIGPNAILQRYMGECIAAAGASGRVLPTLRKHDDGSARIEEAALRAHLLSDKPRLESCFPQAGRHVRLPNYPWQRERHWHPRTSEGHALIERQRVHPLLGWRLTEADWAWENILDPIVLPWLSDHKVGGAVVLPGSAYAEMALAAAYEWQGGNHFTIKELDTLSPLVFDGEHARTARLKLNPRDGGFQIVSRQRLSHDEWTLHATGRLIEASARNPKERIAPVAERTQRIGRGTHYRLAAQLGLDYGPQFQGFAHAFIDHDRLEAVFDLPASVRSDVSYLLHPAMLDVCYQSLVDFFQTDIEAGEGVALLPVKVGRLDFLRHAEITGFRSRLLRRSARSVLADFELLDAEGGLVASVMDCRFRAAALLRRERSSVACWRTMPWLQPHPAESLKTPLPPTLELLKPLRPAFAGREDVLRRHTWFKETLPLFEALTLSFALEAFKVLFERRPDWLQAALSDPTASPYLHWLADCLRQESLLLERDGAWCLESSHEVPPPEEIWQALLRDAPACLPQLALLARVGRHLPEVLTGEIEGRELLEALRRSPAVEPLHDDDPAYLGTRLAAETVLAGLAGSWPSQRRLRVLEIPAGSSELPRRLVGMLPEDRLDYVLAPPNEETRLRLQAEYQDNANITVAGLDAAGWKLAAEKPLPEVFDVVLLRHFLHAAASPHAALTQAKRWLAPGGVLLLAERYPDWSADMVGGLDPAWWLSDATGQPLSSLLPPLTWQNALREEGFDEIELFAEPAAEGLSEGGYLLLAKRPIEDPIALTAPEVAAWLLLADEASSGMADHLRRHLESWGQRAIVNRQPEAPNMEGFGHVVHLLGWSAPAEALDGPAILHELVQKAIGCGKPPRLWLITKGGALVSGLPEARQPHPAQAALWGFGRVVMNEYPALSCTLIELACDPDAPSMRARLENELLHPDGINEIVLTPKARYSLRLQEDVAEDESIGDPVGDTRYCLDFQVPGQLRNLVWKPGMSRPLLDHEIEVRTHAAGLNFRDVMYLMGLLPDEAVENGFAGASLGLEFAGVVSRVGNGVRGFAPGDAVMGFAPSCFASHVITRADAIAPIPEGWSFDAAATVPTVFFTVYYALKHLADLQPGERVLIHGAAGGVGIAAIQLARHLGAEIFATAGSEEKRDFVRLLGADHVFDSRSLAFADDILAATGGQGVDVVLNSLAGEAIRRNLRVLRPFGRFLELGKRDFFENTPIGLRPFKDNISYFGIDADQLLTGRPGLAARLFREMIALFHEGILSPLPHRTFSAERVVDAFRFMQQARHIGKVVVSLAEAPRRIERQRESRQAIRFDKDSTWLVTGGLAGFGLESARWLAARGVGSLVLLGRRGADTPGATEAIEALKKQGVSVRAIACDVTDCNALGTVIERIQKTLPPLKGILHAAMVIDDALIANLDADKIESVLRPKLLGAWNLHALTQDIPIDHFVLYSSVTTLIGNPGQANYVAANAGLEALAELRRGMGLPATCIGWGPIGDAGYLTRNEAVKDSLTQKLGNTPLDAAEALALLDRLLVANKGPSTAANFEWATLSRLLPSAQSARFASLNRNLNGADLVEDSADFRALIAGKSEEQVAEIVRALVTQEVAQILCIGADRIEPSRSLHDLGMDSLMAVELALGLERRFGVQLPVMMLNEAPTAERVTARIVQRLLGEEAASEQSKRDIETLVENLAVKHGEDITPEEIDRTIEDARALAQKGMRLIA